MPVLAVVNRKGGSGKSTLAAHLAGYCAKQGIPVMLGDVDRQQSTQTWLRLREGRQLPGRMPILGWTVDPKNALRVPPGIAHVILDTPGGIQGFELARVVMLADIILMPLCNSVFDRESAAQCYAELMRLPRVASGRCKVAAVGMRLDARTKGAEVVKQWADERNLPFIGVLRETQGYVKCIEQGLTLFDMSGASVEADMAQWQPILEWLSPVLHAAPVRRTAAREGVQVTARRAIERAVGAAAPSAVPQDPAAEAASPVPAPVPVPMAEPLRAAPPRRAAMPQAAMAAAVAAAVATAAVPVAAAELRAARPAVAATPSRQLDGAPAAAPAQRGAVPTARRAAPTSAWAGLLARVGKLLETVPVPRLLQRHR